MTVAGGKERGGGKKLKQPLEAPDSRKKKLPSEAALPTKVGTKTSTRGAYLTRKKDRKIKK